MTKSVSADEPVKETTVSKNASPLVGTKSCITSSGIEHCPARSCLEAMELLESTVQEDKIEHYLYQLAEQPTLISEAQLGFLQFPRYPHEMSEQVMMFGPIHLMSNFRK